MKKHFLKQIALTVAMMSATAAGSFAGVFYVCDGTEFTLTAGTPGDFTDYEWMEGGNSVGTQYQLTLTSTLGNATTAETRTFELRVKDADCWSDPVTHTVHILPKITVSISDPNSLFCGNESVNTTLTANTNTASFSNMPGGITYSYAWEHNSTPTGSDQNTLNATTAGNYEVTVSYNLSGAGTVDAENLTDCVATNTHDIQLTTAPTAPNVTFN